MEQNEGVKKDRKLSRNRSIILAMQGASVAICLWMCIGPKPAASAQNAPDSRIAVLETRANEIEQHLRNTDTIEDRLWTAVNAQSHDIAEMQGEERAGFGFLTLLTGCTFVFQIRKKKAE